MTQAPTSLLVYDIALKYSRIALPDMPQLATQIDSIPLLNLKRLLLLRNIVIGFDIAAIIISVQMLGMALPLLPLCALLLFYILINGLSWLRLKKEQQVSTSEFAFQLAIDTIIFTLLLYHVGGYTNPFVSLFLIPLVITAATLPKKFIWSMAGLTISCYTLLMFQYIPLPHVHMMHETRDFDLHVLGMWFSFLLSVSLVLFFVVKMASSLRERDQALAIAREKALQDEHLVTLGTLATGAAHELGTPLSTMAVLAKELHTEQQSDDELREKADIIRQQVERCKTIISDISTTTGQTRAEGGKKQEIQTYLEQTFQQWHSLRPEAHAKLTTHGQDETVYIFADKTLTQALLNLLNNAADASINHIDITAQWDNETLNLLIIDQGPGIAGDIKNAIGQPFFTTKKDGYGLGLYLAHAVIERYGGNLTLSNRTEGGVAAQVTLPLQRLARS